MQSQWSLPSISPHSPRNETPLHALVRENQYDSALVRIHKYPEDVSSVDCLDRTPLHELCDKRNLDQTAVFLAEAIVLLRPELAGMPDSIGWTPLHYCLQRRKTWTGKRVCRRSSDCVALVLIHAHPEAVNCVRETSDGLMTPFHLACQNDADVTVLRAMLEVNPALASQHDNRGTSNNPIQLLWKANQSAMGKLALLLLTAFEGKVVTSHRHILHACCSQECPQELVFRIMETYPASERDDQGNLPLHYAIRGEDSIVIRRLVAAYPEALYTLDADTLFPVLACALRATENRFHLSLTFELLLAAPDIVLRAL
jgi:ankyrin repeat protein